MKPTIPPELWIEIIDNLHNDEPTLRKCGLVCRFWLWSSRSHLFHSVCLSPFDFDTALSVLCAPGSTIPPHVRALKIDGRPGWQPSCVINVLPKLPQLSAVEKLFLSYVVWDDLTPEAKERLFTISHGLKKLILDDMVFKSLGQAFQLISSAPSLESLSLGNMHHQSEDTSLTKFSAPPIKHVVFGWNNCIPVVIDWLCHWQATPSVRNLTFDGVNEEDIPSISAYIRRLGPVLEHLELAFSALDYYAATQALKEIDLTHSTSLKTILINSLIFCKDLPGPRNYDWIIDILSRITSRFIERVTLVVRLDTPQHLAHFNLPTLAALFAHANPTFSELSTRLQFGIDGSVDKMEAQAAITESLHELAWQGRLEFGGCQISQCL